MVRETRHLWVGNLPDTIREDKILDHFKRFVLYTIQRLYHIQNSASVCMCVLYDFRVCKKGLRR